MKKTYIVLILFMCCIVYLSGQAAEESLQKMEARLSQATGKERVELLLKVSREYAYKAPPRRLKLVREAHRIVQTLEDPKLEVQVLNSLSRSYFGLNRFPEALEIATEARKKARLIGDRKEFGLAVSVQGGVQQNQGNYRDSLKFHNEALSIWKELDDKKRIAQTLGYLGSVYDSLGDPQRAVQFLLEGLNLAGEIDDKEAKAILHTNLGVVYVNLKQLENARENFSKASQIHRALNNIAGMANSYNNLGLIYIEKDFDIAYGYFTKALELHKEVNDRYSMGIAYSNLGELYENKGDLNRALEYYQKSLTISREINDNYGIAYNLKYMAVVYRKQGQYRKALSLAEQALAEAQKRDAKDMISESHQELAEIYSAMGDFKKAFQHHKEFKTVNDSIYNQDSADKITEMQAKYEFENQQKEIQFLKEKEQLQEVQLERQEYQLRLYFVIGILVMLIAIIYYFRYRNKRKAEKAIRQSEEKYRKLVERANDGIIILQDGVFKYANPSFFHMFGYTPEEIEARSFKDLLPPEENERVGGFYRRRMAGEQVPAKYETRLVRKNGDIIPVEINAGLIHFEDRLADMVIVRDISGRQQLEAERIQRGKLEAVGILAGGIAHDFNNLLSVILGNIEMARHFTPDDNTLLNILGKAEKASLKARELGLRFLTFSEGGEPYTKIMSLKPLLSEAADIIRGDWNVQFEFELPKDLWQIACDPDQIHQAFMDLMMNAAEAMDGKGTVEITAENSEVIASGIQPLQPGKYVKLTFRDSGEGISPEHLPRIFDLYFSTRQRVSQKGLGFGLSIVYSILKRHKGHIDVTSEVGVGTEVTVYIPASVR